MEKVVESADQIYKTFESIQSLIDEFRKKIPRTKSLAKDTKVFCEQLEKHLEFDVVDEMLTEVKDLREKIQKITVENEDLEKSKDRAEADEKKAQQELEDIKESLARFLRDDLLPKEPDAILREKVEIFADELIRDPQISVSDLSLRI